MGNQNWYYKPSQLSRMREITDLGGEHITSPLLIQHNPNYTLNLHSYIMQSRKHSFARDRDTTENHNPTKCRVMDPSPNGYIYKTNLTPNILEEGTERL